MADVPYVFLARAVYVGRSEQAECFMVALADHAEGTDEAFILMLADNFNESDRLLGTDTYVLTTGAGITFHGGVLGAWVGEEGVEFHLTSSAAGVLGVPGRFRVGFAHGRAAQVRSGLARVLGAETVDCPQ